MWTPSNLLIINISVLYEANNVYLRYKYIYIFSRLVGHNTESFEGCGESGLMERITFVAK